MKKYTVVKVLWNMEAFSLEIKNSKKLNTLTLSGLMIGPILGSGTILLPPIAIKILNDKAIYAWIIIMILGAVFAWVFTQMSLLSPGNEGVNAIIGEKLGNSFGELSSNYLISAVCFGPVAVMFTATDFLKDMLPYKGINQGLIAIIFMLISICVLLAGVKAIGSLTLVLSSLTAVVLLVSSIVTLLKQPHLYYPAGFPSIIPLGATLLLLFWAIIGWEVVGNYVEEVNNPQKTIMNAMKLSLFVLIIVYLVSTFALQNSVVNFNVENNINMSLVLFSIFGKYSTYIMGLIASGLCFCTLIMILGAVTRQISARAKNGTLPSFFVQKPSEKSPKIALFALTLIHIIWITLVSLNIISVQWLVSMANVFFIANALLGLVAGLFCVRAMIMKVLVFILILCLTSLLLFSNIIGWILLILVTIGSIFKYKLKVSQKAVE